MLHVAAMATAVLVFSQVAASSVHAHDTNGTPHESSQHDSCAACVLGAATPSPTAAPDCPAAQVVETFHQLEALVAPVIVARFDRPPARAPPVPAG